MPRRVILVPDPARAAAEARLRIQTALMQIHTLLQQLTNQMQQPRQQRQTPNRFGIHMRTEGQPDRLAHNSTVAACRSFDVAILRIDCTTYHRSAQVPVVLTAETEMIFCLGRTISPFCQQYSLFPNRTR